MADLALFGGAPVIRDPLPPYPSLGAAEEAAVTAVVRSGCLSGFYGSWEEGFLGGPRVREFEAAWTERFGIKHAISVNSNTSGLSAAIGAARVSPGDEVIVPATTMSATAMAPLVYGAIPVFSDIDEDTFCLDLESVRANLTERTRAILAVNLFGQAAPLTALRELADENELVLIEDNAQSPLATENDRYCGTIGHIGVFSLNYHKHIHTGEGGMCVTDDDDLARRLRFIRNHAEAVVEDAGVEDLTNMVGFNFRMTELSAAVGLAQLAAADEHVGRRQHLAERLSEGVGDLEGITAPYVREGCRHVYYCWVPRYDADAMGPSRGTFVKALNAEGFPCTEGYARPLYLLPLFQRRRAIGRDGFPFTLTDRRYDKGLCPSAERLYDEEIIVFEPCAYGVDDNLTDRLVEAFRKVHAARAELADWEMRRAS